MAARLSSAPSPRTRRPAHAKPARRAKDVSSTGRGAANRRAAKLKPKGSASFVNSPASLPAERLMVQTMEEAVVHRPWSASGRPLKRPRIVTSKTSATELHTKPATAPRAARRGLACRIASRSSTGAAMTAVRGGNPAIFEVARVQGVGPDAAEADDDGQEAERQPGKPRSRRVMRHIQDATRPAHLASRAVRRGLSLQPGTGAADWESQFPPIPDRLVGPTFEGLSPGDFELGATVLGSSDCGRARLVCPALSIGCGEGFAWCPLAGAVDDSAVVDDDDSAGDDDDLGLPEVPVGCRRGLGCGAPLPVATGLVVLLPLGTFRRRRARI